jgi:tetratricopeptide (TPR) repeat protein
MLLDTLAVNPKAQKVRWTLAEIYWKNGQHDEAIAELKKIEEQVRASGEAPPPDFYYRLGLIYLSMPEPDYPAALAAFETESQQNKLNYMALVKAAEVHMIDGRWDTALAKADQAIGLAKEIPDAYVVKADILMRRNDPGDTVQAQYVLKVALNLKDKFHRARLKMAEIEINRQRRSEQPDYSQAIQMLLTVYMEIEKISPKVRSDEDRQSQAEAARWMAEIEWAKRNLSEAEKTLRKTIAAYPKYAEGYRLLGRLLTESDLAEYKGAKEAYLKAIELEPGHVQTYKEIGSLCDRYLRQYEEAIGYYQEYLRRKGPEKEEVERWLEESKRALAIPAALATSGTAPATTTSGTAGAPTATAAAAVTTGTAPAPATTGTIPAPAKTGAIPAPAPPRPGAPKAR